jgi:acyl dehydratase
VRFPAPVVSGSRLRARAVLASVEPAGAGAVQAAFQVTIEVDGGGKPVCVATALCRYYRQP